MANDVFTGDLDQVQHRFWNRDASIAGIYFGYIRAVNREMQADCGLQVSGIDVRSRVADGISGGETALREPSLDVLQTGVDEGERRSGEWTRASRWRWNWIDPMCATTGAICA